MDDFFPIWKSIKLFFEKDTTTYTSEVSVENCFMVNVHFDAAETSASFCNHDGSIAVMAGNPLLAEQENSNRDIQLGILHQQLTGGIYDAARASNGMYCAAGYDRRTNTFYLVVDKFGLRPLYYMQYGDIIIFSSLQRLFEELDELPLVMSVRGVSEQIAFGAPLSDRTPYANLRCLHAAGIVRFSGKTVHRQTYWIFEHELPDIKFSLPRCVEDLHDLFLEAVRIRLVEQETVVRAFLSSGLDSRCVIGGLLECGVRPVTYNFSAEKTYDQLISREFAAYLGLEHHAVTINDERKFSEHALWLNNYYPYQEINIQEIPRPQTVWTGDGGSVGAGYVYLTEDMVRLLRAGKDREAVRLFIDFTGSDLAARMLKIFSGISAGEFLIASVMDELKRIDCEDPGRKLFFFLMRNDQRRHFAVYHLERIDTSRVEFIAPFFDPKFLCYFSSLPVDTCLKHAMYMQWMNCFRPSLTDIAWQAYPGHVPCPLPMPSDGRYQWANDKRHADRYAMYLLKRIDEEIQRDLFPSPLVSKNISSVMKFLTRFHVRGYEYALQQLLSYNKYWKICQGVYENDIQ